MQSPIKLGLLSLAALTLTACGTIHHGTQQKIMITTPPTTGASCQLSNKIGKYRLQSTPGTVDVKRANTPLTITCHKAGYPTRTKIVKAKLHATMVGNVALPGGSVGAGVDVVNGAAFTYPKEIAVSLGKQAAKPKKHAKKMHLTGKRTSQA